MGKGLIVSVILLLSTAELLANIGHFDLYKVIWQGREYYIKLDSPGVLQNNDLCYYDDNGEYMMEVENYIEERLLRNIEMSVYTGASKIVLDSLRRDDGQAAGLESPIWVLKGWKLIHPDSLLGKYELKNAVKGHTYGTDSSQTITEIDNNWINRSIMRHVFTVDNGECTYNFYSARIKSGSEKCLKMQSELQELMPKGEGELNFEVAAQREERFRRRIEELVKEEILMIGGCSC